MWRDDAYLLDMLLAAREIRQFTHGKNLEEFLQDRLLQHAVMRLVQMIGEASRKVSPEFKASHPELPWESIIGLRNRLVHEYFRILPERVWEVVRDDISPLIGQLEPLVPPDEPLS